VMPAFGELLGPGKVQVLAAYVWGLSNAPQTAAPAANAPAASGGSKP
jgi:cytochrome c oxidase cbb3-type subunit 3